MSTPSANPKVGIALAVYRPSPQFFLEQIKSILFQDYQNWFCVISTNSPVRGVIDILNSEGISDPRLTIVENLEELGSKKNFMFALRKVLERGCQYFAFADQDDVWYPQKISAAVSMLEGWGPNCLYHCDMKVLRKLGDQWIIDPQTAWKQERRVVDFVETENFCLRNVCTGASLVGDASLIQKHLDIPDAIPNHDWWIAAIFSRYGQIKKDSTPWYEYRQHETNELGITPYKGYFTRRKFGLKDAFKKTVSLWLESHTIAKGFEERGIRIRGYLRFALLSHLDLGLFFGVGAIRYLFSDPALSRAYFSRFVGKFIHTVLRVPPLPERTPASQS